MSRSDPISEFELIRRIRGLMANFQKEVLVGIGDDAAVIKARENEFYLFTTDTLVEDVHFKWEFISPWQLGWKALAVNVSDIAAMGGYPTFALVTLGFPPETSSSRIEDIYKGLQELSSGLKVEIIGGDVVRSPVFFITLSLLGEVEVGKAILRSGATPGDTIYLTGDVGAAAAGLILLTEKEVALRPSVREFLKKRWLLPFPRVKEGRQIALQGLATAMIDISDGLVSDLYHILEESKVGAEIWAEKLPIASETKEALSWLNKSSLEVALQGGEDYELLFTAPSIKDVEKILDFPVTPIGKILGEEPKLWLVDKEGRKRKLEPKGWDHFRESSVF